VILSKLFWDGRNLNFSVEWDSTKYKEWVGEKSSKTNQRSKFNAQNGESEKSKNLCCQGGTTVRVLGIISNLTYNIKAIISNFTFLRIFQLFLFCIGFWCEHKSFR